LLGGSAPHPRIVKSFDVVKHIGLGRIEARVPRVMDTFTLEQSEEALT